MDNIMEKILTKVKDNPALYICKPDVQLLRYFIDGYVMTYSLFPWGCSREFCRGFMDFVMEKYKIKEQFLFHWTSVFLYFTNSEEEAFYKFFEVLEEFASLHANEICDAVVDREVSEEDAFCIIGEMIGRVKIRPRLYIGLLSMVRLKAFINGCMAYINEINGSATYEFYPGFQSFVERKYDIRIEADWAKIITFVTDSEEEAIEKFFELLEEFKETKEHKNFLMRIMKGDHYE